LELYTNYSNFYIRKVSKRGLMKNWWRPSSEEYMGSGVTKISKHYTEY
jgi:CRISPR/Cas system CMR-associated protein Cmr1 (group 7 of RAMP superfamily)